MLQINICFQSKDMLFFVFIIFWNTEDFPRPNVEFGNFVQTLSCRIRFSTFSEGLLFSKQPDGGYRTSLHILLYCILKAACFCICRNVPWYFFLSFSVMLNAVPWLSFLLLLNKLALNFCILSLSLNSFGMAEMFISTENKDWYLHDHTCDLWAKTTEWLQPWEELLHCVLQPRQQEGDMF